jgi:hypothetical protein
MLCWTVEQHLRVLKMHLSNWKKTLSDKKNVIKTESGICQASVLSFSKQRWKGVHQDLMSWQRAWKYCLVNPWSTKQIQTNALCQHPGSEILITFEGQNYYLKPIGVRSTRMLDLPKDFPTFNCKTFAATWPS